MNNKIMMSRLTEAADLLKSKFVCLADSLVILVLATTIHSIVTELNAARYTVITIIIIIADNGHYNTKTLL